MRRLLVIIFWICFAASAAVYAVMLFWSLPKIAAAAGGLAPFDLRPAGYSLDEAKSFLAALSADGRDFYDHTQRALDSVYPLLLATTLGVGLWIVVPGSPHWVREPLVLIPVLAMIADLTENQLIARMLDSPVQSLDATTVMMASTTTIVKSILTTYAISALLILSVLNAWTRRRRS